MLKQNNIVPFIRNATLQSREPSWTENATHWLARQFGGGRMDPHLENMMASLSGVRDAKKVTGLLEWLPGTGDAIAVDQSVDAFKRGDNLTGGLLATAAAVGAVPVVGRVAAKGIRKTAKKLAAREKALWTGAATRNVDTPEPAKAIVNTPDLRLMPVDEAVAVARTQPHLIQGKGGQYVGAPRGATKMSHIVKNRQTFDEHVEAGASGMDWYWRSRAFNVASQPTKAKQSLAAREQALWSSQATPDPNLNWAVEGRISREAGRMPEKIKTTQQATAYREGRPLGKKTGVFGQHLDPHQPHATTGTNDIWHARAFGYKGAGGKPFDKALSTQEHRFIDYETMLAVDRANIKAIGGRTDWTAEKLQAAAWVAAKGRKIAKDRNLSEAEGIAIASKSYPEHAAKYTVSVPSEQIPGKSTGVLKGLLTAGDGARGAFSREAAWSGRNRPDPLLGDVFGGYNLPAQRGTGAYRNTAGDLELNPVEVGRQMTPFGAQGGKRFIPDYMEEGLSSTQAVRGLLDMQEGSAWGKVITHSTGPKTAFNLNMSKAPTKAQMRQAIELAERYNIGVVANKDGGLAFQRWTGEFTKLRKNASQKALIKADKANAAELNRLLQGELGDGLRKIFPGSTYERGIWAGDYIDLSAQLAAKHAGKGRATRAVLKRLRGLKKTAPGLYENLINSKGVQTKATKNLKRLEKWEKTLGVRQRSDYKKLLQIVGDAKLKGLIDYVKKYGSAGLPVFAAAAVSSRLRDATSDKNSIPSDGRI